MTRQQQKPKGKQAPKRAVKKSAKLGNAAPPQTIIIQDSDNQKQADTMFGLNSLETTILKYTVGGGVVIVGVLILTGKLGNWIDKNRMENHLIKSTETGTADFYARELAEAFSYFDWDGNTDRAKVKLTLEAIPSRAVWEEVQRIYSKNYKQMLLTDLKEELSTIWWAFNYRDAEMIFANYK
jgi:hypothetical protein